MNLPLPFLLTLCILLSTTNAHNITRILAKHPEFSSFNHYLTVTHLAGEINRRQTITVCAINNAAMDELLSKQYSITTIKNILSLHVFADYFGSKKLHQLTKGTTTTSTLFQATGEATGTSGYVNITDLKGGKVGFSTGEDGELTATYVKSVEEMPYNISVIQISHMLTSPEAAAPTTAPSDLNITSLMMKQGCKAFADLLVGSKEASDTFRQNVEGGLTVFCPTDKAIDDFRPKFKNLTAAGKVSLLLYHGVPVYESLGMLKSNNGVMNTLATEGANKYDFTIQNDDEDVKVKTKVVTASITGTIIDEEPLAVFKVDKVLLPRELFKAPKEAPGLKADSPDGDSEDADAPGPAGEEDDTAADQTANGAFRMTNGGWFVSIVLSLFVGIFML